MRRLLRGLLVVVAGLAVAGVFAIGAFFATLWVEHNVSLELPRPTGSFAVGRMNTAWVDTARMDPFAPAPAPRRELVVWIWYPAQRADSAHEAEYVPALWRSALAKHASAMVTQFFIRNPTKVRGHSIENATVAAGDATYPVVIFNSGIGALALQYSALVEDLVSHGYIVVGMDRPYSTSVVVMPDGRVIALTARGNPGDGRVAAANFERAGETVVGVWTADTRFVLDQLARINEHDASGKLTGRMNLTAVGVVGHSIGGASAAQFCHDDSRCRAGIDIDGALHGSVIPESMPQPFMFLVADHTKLLTAADSQISAEIHSASKRAPADKLTVTLIGAHHFSFGDQALTQSRILRSVLVRISGEGRLDPRTGLASTSRYVRAFFDVHLRGASRDALYSAPLVAGARLEAK